MGEETDDIINSQKSTQTQTQTLKSLSLEDDSECKSVLASLWGRLYSCVSFIQPVDLFGADVNLGRDEKNTIVIHRHNFPPNQWLSVSKIHFVITRDDISGVVCIKDNSKNGTFVNGTLIGRGKKNVLQNNDSIAVLNKDLKLFIYKPMEAEDDDYLPAELNCRYKVSTVLGRGGCGEVRLVFEKATCHTFAVKKITKGKNVSNVNQLNHPTKIMNEVKILQSLAHPFIIGVREIIETETDVFIILEYMRGGELNNRIMDLQNCSESNVKLLFYQMAQAVQYLHYEGIIHRDLKPENVLLESEAEETLVKLTDFGLSKILDEETLMQTICGTPCYVAPEILDGRYDEYDKQVDIWSLGVILYYMLGKELPFIASDRPSLNKLILRGQYDMKTPYWKGISHLAIDLVSKMLVVNPKKRIDIENVLNHPWLSKDVAMQYKVKQLVDKSLEEMEQNIRAEVNSESPPPKKRCQRLNSGASSETTGSR